MSLEAHGKLGEVVYQKVRKTGTQYARKHVVPTDRHSPAQINQRSKLAPANAAWKSLTIPEQKQYDKRAKNLNQSGYNLFISEYLLNN
jgi:hypothetical protein